MKSFIATIVTMFAVSAFATDAPKASATPAAVPAVVIPVATPVAPTKKVKEAHKPVKSDKPVEAATTAVTPTAAAPTGK